MQNKMERQIVIINIEKNRSCKYRTNDVTKKLVNKQNMFKKKVRIKE